MSGHSQHQRRSQQQRGGQTSLTQTEQVVQGSGVSEIGTLRLRPPTTSSSTNNGDPSRTPPQQRRRVVWSEGTVDNEGLGRKSSKICCIYHKPKAFDESSDSSSSSSGEDEDDSSESDSDSSSHSCSGRGILHDSDASSGPEMDGPNASKSLQQKKALQHQHKHKHNDSSACSKHKAVKRTSKRTRGSVTQTSTVQSTASLKQSGPSHDAHNESSDSEVEPSGSQHPSKPNAYERGIR